ncbi:hypothetical protein N2152v2_005041 [Parachlorella kessleri]
MSTLPVAVNRRAAGSGETKHDRLGACLKQERGSSACRTDNAAAAGSHKQPAAKQEALTTGDWEGQAITGVEPTAQQPEASGNAAGAAPAATAGELEQVCSSCQAQQLQLVQLQTVLEQQEMRAAAAEAVAEQGQRRCMEAQGRLTQLQTRLPAIMDTIRQLQAANKAAQQQQQQQDQRQDAKDASKQPTIVTKPAQPAAMPLAQVEAVQPLHSHRRISSDGNRAIATHNALRTPDLPRQLRGRDVVGAQEPHVLKQLDQQPEPVPSTHEQLGEPQHQPLQQARASPAATVPAEPAAATPLCKLAVSVSPASCRTNNSHQQRRRQQQQTLPQSPLLRRLAAGLKQARRTQAASNLTQTIANAEEGAVQKQAEPVMALPQKTLMVGVPEEQARRRQEQPAAAAEPPLQQRQQPQVIQQQVQQQQGPQDIGPGKQTLLQRTLTISPGLGNHLEEIQGRGSAEASPPAADEDRYINKEVIMVYMVQLASGSSLVTLATQNVDASLWHEGCLLGSTCSKVFGKTRYKGRVVSYDKDRQWYLVRFTDGDEEEMTEAELLQCLRSRRVPHQLQD